MNRRTILHWSVIAGVGSLAGCLGGDDEEAEDDGETPSDDSPGESDQDTTDDIDDGTQDTDTGDGEGEEDDFDDSPERSEEQLTIEEDLDSYVVETDITQEEPNGDELITEAVLRQDDANERAHFRYEISRPDEEPLVMEYFRIEDNAYQIMPEEECAEIDQDMTSVQAGQVAGIRMPSADDIDEADNVEYHGEETVDGFQTELWVFDLGESIDFAGGEMRVWIATDTNHIVRISGWYPMGAGDEQGEISFEQRYHSFNEDLGIELPESCEE